MSPLRACLSSYASHLAVYVLFASFPKTVETNSGHTCFSLSKKSSYIWKCSSFYVLLCIPPTTRSKIATCAQTIHMAPGKSAPGLWEVQLRIVLRSDFLHHFWRGAKPSKGNYTSISVCSSKVRVHTQEWA